LHHWRLYKGDGIVVGVCGGGGWGAVMLYFVMKEILMSCTHNSCFAYKFHANSSIFTIKLLGCVTAIYLYHYLSIRSVYLLNHEITHVTFVQCNTPDALTLTLTQDPSGPLWVNRAVPDPGRVGVGNGLSLLDLKFKYWCNCKWRKCNNLNLPRNNNYCWYQNWFF
jgi:hypothetical protein